MGQEKFSVRRKPSSPLCPSCGERGGGRAVLRLTKKPEGGESFMICPHCGAKLPERDVEPIFKPSRGRQIGDRVFPWLWWLVLFLVVVAVAIRIAYEVQN